MATTIIQITLLLPTFSASASSDGHPLQNEVSIGLEESEHSQSDFAETSLDAIPSFSDDEQVQNDRQEQSIKNKPCAITWQPNGGRFGDDLASYCRTKWLSRELDIPLLCLPFPYSDQLMLHENEELCTAECRQQFSKIVQLIKKPPYVLSKNNNTLYICRWKTEVTIDWFDQSFLIELKKNITPRYEIQKIEIPAEVVSIAAHVRNGGTFAADTPEEKERCPLRFVPEEFFIDQIERLAAMFPADNLYVYIFTDHPEPAKLAKKFTRALNDPRITFDYRKEDNSHKANVLEDFFSMMDFDCLIRPGSNFTRFVQRLGNNKVVIYPESVKEIAPGKKVIDTIKVKTRTDSDERWKTQNITIA